MNPVCPGFMAHHVKPNRCRRCFRDIHDHDNDISTSFTISLPRRRRESAAVESINTSANASSSTTSRFDISSLGRRTRQRSASTSSWFQEDKQVVKKEQIDALFQNADDSKIRASNSIESDDSTSTTRTRLKNSEDSDKKEESNQERTTNQNSEDKPSDWPSWRTQYRRDANSSSNSTIAKSSSEDKPATSLSSETQNEVSSSESRSSPKFSKSQTSPSKETDSKAADRKAVSNDVSNLKSTDTSIVVDKKSVTSRLSGSRWSEKSAESKVLKPELKPKESKISSVASRFESPGSKTDFGVGRKFSLTKTVDSKPKDEVTDKKQEEDKKDIKSRPWLKDTKSKEEQKVDKSNEENDAKPEEDKTNIRTRLRFTDTKPKEESGDSTVKDQKDAKPEDKKEIKSRPWLKDTKPKEEPKDTKPEEEKKEIKSRPWLKDTKPKEEPKETKPVEENKEIKPRPWLKDTKLKEEPKGTKPEEDKKDTKPRSWLKDTKPKEEPKDTKPEEDKKDSRSRPWFRDNKPKEEPKTTKLEEVKKDGKPRPWLKDTKSKEVVESKETKIVEDTTKKPEKSVLSRFPSYKKDEPKPVVIQKPKTPPPSSSSSEEESESDSEGSSPTSASKVGSIKPVEIKSTADVAFVVKLRPSPSPTRASVQDDKVKEQEKRIQEQESKLSDLQKTLEILKKDLKKSEDTCTRLSREKADLDKKKHLLDKDKEKLDKTVEELSRMKSKMSDLQSAQDRVKEDNKKLKQDLDKSKQETDRSKNEMDRSKQDLDKSKEELQKAKQEMEKTKHELENSKHELDKTKTDMEKSKKECEKSKSEFSRYKQELENSKLELSKLKKELDNKQESKQKVTPTPQVVQDTKSKQVTDQLKQKLQQSETLCQELMEENEDIKKEVRDLEQELEELHDNFREDQASEFRGLKKELETATKNCRVLQFKLRKAEKRCEQLELDRHGLEDKVREFQGTTKLDVNRSKTKELENELKMSKNLTLALNTEIDSLKEALKRSEVENEALRQSTTTPTITHGNRSLTPTTQNRLSPVPSRDGISTPLGKDYDSIARELYDTMERENDLREQLKFSEEEARSGRRKMSSLEQENETLMLQMKKLNSMLRSRKDSTNKEKQKAMQGEKDDDEEEEMSSDNLKLQLDLQEQEMAVLRRKLEDTERENENFQSEVKYLQEKLINQPLIQMTDFPEDTSGTPSTGSVYWEKKAQLLQHELRETRKKTIEKEREIERLNAEVEILRKKASRMMVRSRSLDSDLQVDLKRQLQLVEQEASILRQKVTGLETDNDNLTTENKRLTLRISKKPPMTSQELLHLDNLELKQKNEDLQRKMDSLKLELAEKTGKNDNPVAVLQDYKPRRESLTSMTDNETDLIHALKKKMKSLEDEHQTLQSKCMHLEIDNNRLSRDHRRLKEALATKKKPLKAIRDSATRIELRELVNELQDEISELQVSLRGREVVQEGLEEELERCKKELREALKDTKLREDKMKDELTKGQKEKENLQKETEAQKKRASAAEEQFKQVSCQLGADQMELLKKVRKLQEDLHESERKAKAAEENLEKKTRRLRETQEKLNALTALKEDLVRTNRLVESQKEDLVKELDDRKDLLSKAETRITDLRNQVENTDRDLTSLRKECNQLRNELEDEKSRLKLADKKNASDQHSLFAKEREDLRRANVDLRSRIENLQQQINHNEQIWIEKESRLRDDHKRKKEFAVREAREKGEAALELAKEEEKILRNKVQEISEKLEKAEASFKEAQEKIRQAAAHQRRDKEDWQKEKEDLEAKLRVETKKRDRMERELDQSSRQKNEELIQAKERLVQVEREQRRMQIQLQEAEEAKQKNEFFEKELDKARKEYDDLTSKYDQLEADLVRTKSRLVQDKEMADTQVCCLQRDLNDLKAEMASSKDTYTLKQDSWIKEKLDLQELLKEYEQRLERLKAVEQEQSRLKSAVEEKETLIESYRKEEKHLKDERERLRKTVEDMSKASEVQRQAWMTSMSSSGNDTPTVKQVAVLKADYEGRMALMSSEMVNMQHQIANLVKERDELKSRLTTAERNAEEFKTGSLKREKARHREEAELARRKVKELRIQMDELKEQLEDTVLENRNLKLQLETDRNTCDIQTAELKSKINQLEEQKILESTRGQTRSLAKTRLELAWDKERTELQHLLSETQKMVVDLKGRIGVVQGEMDIAKKTLRQQMEHSRDSAERLSQDSRRKMSELHSSLLDMRESQAKLRGLYDRMKRDREALLSEREEWRQKLQMYQQLYVKVLELQQDVEVVSSATVDNTDNSKQAQVKETLTKMKDRFSELYKTAVAIREEEKIRRTTSFRRAVSAQEMTLSQRNVQPQKSLNKVVGPSGMILRPPPRQKALNRKSLSLDHTLVGGHSAADSLKIWESEGEASVGSTPAGSLLSLRMGYESDSSFADYEYRKYGGSLQDYRSGGTRRYLQTPSGMTDSEAPSSREGSIATSCESVPVTVHQSTQHKKATLKDKLKFLRRAKSIEVTNLTSATKEAKESSLRSKISKVLKKPLMGRSLSTEVHKCGPTLPPKGAFPEAIPKRPTAVKPLSASRGELSTQRPLAVSDGGKIASRTGRETPV